MADATQNPDDPQTQPSYEDFQRDYWAPDREQVLAGMAPKPPEAPSVSAPAAPAPTSSAPYTPPNGNTGISGYGPGGVPAPAVTSAGSPAPTAAPWQQTATPGGFDQGKWNDPNKSDPKYDIGHMVASGMSNDQIAQYVAQKFPGWSIVGTDTIRDPQGNVFDFRRDQEGANAPFWEQAGGGAGGVGGGTGTAGAAGGLGTQGANGFNSGFSDQVRQALMQQLGIASNPVTGNDPGIKAEMDAQTAGADRLRRDQRASDAERQAMNGLLNGGQSSGAFEQNVSSGFENEQQQLSGVRAQLFTREIQSRRTQVAQLLAQAMQSGDAESQRNLQYQLAQLDEAYRRAALAQNQGQFNDNFGWQVSQGMYNRDKDLATFGAGGY